MYIHNGSYSISKKPFFLRLSKNTLPTTMYTVIVASDGFEIKESSATEAKLQRTVLAMQASIDEMQASMNRMQERQPSKRAPSSTNPYQQLQPPHPTYTNCNHLTPLSTLHTSHLTEAHPTHRLLGPIPTIVCGAWSTSILAIGPHLRSNPERWEVASVATLTTNTRRPTGLSFAAWGRGKGTVVLTTTHLTSCCQPGHLTTNTRGPTGVSLAAWGRGKGTVILTTTHLTSCCQPDHCRILTTNTHGPTGVSLAAWGRSKGTVILTTTHLTSCCQAIIGEETQH
ncbi:hypothetical protein EMCRGX_G005157 [Ephydatia muelleri]